MHFDWIKDILSLRKIPNICEQKYFHPTVTSFVSREGKGLADGVQSFQVWGHQLYKEKYISKGKVQPPWHYPQDCHFCQVPWCPHQQQTHMEWTHLISQQRKHLRPPSSSEENSRAARPISISSVTKHLWDLSWSTHHQYGTTVCH